MLVRAAIAAYEPPLAFVPQMAIAAKRPPTSRAVFAASPLGENPQIAVPYVTPMIHGAAPGGAKKVRRVQARGNNNANEEVRYQFVQENQADRVCGIGVQCKDASGTKVREVHSVVLVCGSEHRLGVHYESPPLPVHKQTGGEAAKYLRNDVSRSLGYGETVEENVNYCHRWAEVATRRCRAYHERNDDTHSISEADSKY